jgi:hypothetical protein
MEARRFHLGLAALLTLVPRAAGADTAWPGLPKVQSGWTESVGGDRYKAASDAGDVVTIRKLRTSTPCSDLVQGTNQNGHLVSRPSFLPHEWGEAVRSSEQVDKRVVITAFARSRNPGECLRLSIDFRSQLAVNDADVRKQIRSLLEGVAAPVGKSSAPRPEPVPEPEPEPEPEPSPPTTKVQPSASLFDPNYASGSRDHSYGIFTAELMGLRYEASMQSSSYAGLLHLDLIGIGIPGVRPLGFNAGFASGYGSRYVYDVHLGPSVGVFNSWIALIATAGGGADNAAVGPTSAWYGFLRGDLNVEVAQSFRLSTSARVLWRRQSESPERQIRGAVSFLCLGADTWGKTCWQVTASVLLYDFPGTNITATGVGLGFELWGHD